MCHFMVALDFVLAVRLSLSYRFLARSDRRSNRGFRVDGGFLRRCTYPSGISKAAVAAWPCGGSCRAGKARPWRLCQTSRRLQSASKLIQRPVYLILVISHMAPGLPILGNEHRIARIWSKWLRRAKIRFFATVTDMIS